LPEGEDEDILLYRYNEVENEQGFELENIETDDEFDAVEEVFVEFLGEDEEWEDEDEYEFEDEEDEDEE
jgi:uncharacterized protein YrzB (UPF0473 family)